MTNSPGYENAVWHILPLGQAVEAFGMAESARSVKVAVSPWLEEEISVLCWSSEEWKASMARPTSRAAMSAPISPREE